MIEELDWSVGLLLDHLKKLGLDENTLVMFTSDNGAQAFDGTGGWVWNEDWDGRYTRAQIGYHSGSNSPFRGTKTTTWEGGVRVQAIFQWPGVLPEGCVSEQLTTAMDLLPTLVGLAGGHVPADRIIDGHDIWPVLMCEPRAGSPYEAFITIAMIVWRLFEAVIRSCMYFVPMKVECKYFMI